MKSRFVSTASHEFRTPLSAILITSDSLLTYWDRMETGQIKDKLTKINNQVLHLTKIVNDVLQLSKIEEGKVEYNPVDIDIIEICRQVIDTFNSDPKLGNKVTLSTPFNSAVMKLDTRLIFQVINNLVSNGIKYSPENPAIKVEVTRKNNELCITVSDNGIGIPEPDQKHLFKPFYRASNTTLFQGNGLGLSIVKESVQLHGGHITFKSRVGHGTSFFITFPDSLIKSYE
ncbi:MAG: HAMP domain-containing histidine kinase [Bacteroidales bacterium]|nr:HAMP domain-containing histidine kinase [Bacteroidales bacterium]